MKQVYLVGQKQYAFCARDAFTQEAVIRAASRLSSRNAKAARVKMVERFGKAIVIVNDTGSVAMAGAT
jgi:hypothetical protein